MPSLFNQQISATYKGLLKTTSNGILSSSLAQITDGNGNDSPLSMSITEIQFNTGSNTFKFPTTRGTSGQILKLSDANGTLGWVADASGDVTKTGTIALNTIAVWNDNVDELRSDTTMSINTNHTISLLQPNSVPTDVGSFNIGGGNIANVTGQNNTGFGSQNLNAVLEGSNNTAMGVSSLDSVTSGDSNTGFGSRVLTDLTIGDFNTAIGSSVLNDVSSGDNNTAVGYNAGVNVTTGSGNTYIGKSAGFSGTGSNNIYIGEGSGMSITSGDNNVIIGSNAGNYISGSSNNIIISDGSGNNRIQVSSGGNVGIGVTPSAWRDSVAVNSVIQGADNYAILNRNDGGTKTNYFAQNFYYNASDVGARIDTGKWSLFYSQNQEDGSHGFYTSSDALGSAPSMQSKLTISSGGLATFSNDIELSRGSRTTIYASSSNQGVQLKSNGSGVLQLNADGGGNVTIAENGGNVGIGITPENSTGTWRNLQFGGGNIVFRSSGNNGAFFGTNYLFKTNNSEVYKDSAATSRMYFADDVIKIQQAGIGTAGNSVVWTTPLTITSGGAATFTGASGVKLVTSSASDSRFDFANQGTGTIIAPDGGGWAIGRDASDGTNTDSFAIAYSGTTFPSLTAEAKLRITSGGEVLIGTNTVTSVSKLQLTSSNAFYGFVDRAQVSNIGNPAGFFNSAGTVVGSINTNNTSTSFNTSSDYRLKENVTRITDALSRLNQLKPSRFNFIADADRTVDGFIAHEVQDIVPEAINGEKDAMKDEEFELTPRVEEVTDEEGNVITEAVEAVMETRSVPDYQGIDQSKIVPLLTAAIQEQQTIIEDLKSRIETLEG